MSKDRMLEETPIESELSHPLKVEEVVLQEVAARCRPQRIETLDEDDSADAPRKSAIADGSLFSRVRTRPAVVRTRGPAQPGVRKGGAGWNRTCDLSSIDPFPHRSHFGRFGPPVDEEPVPRRATMKSRLGRRPELGRRLRT